MNRLKKKLVLAAILGSFAGGVVASVPSRAEADIVDAVTGRTGKENILDWFAGAASNTWGWHKRIWDDLTQKLTGCLSERIQDIDNQGARNSVSPSQSFTMIFASDTQIPWWPNDEKDPPNGLAGAFDLTKCDSDECQLLSSVKANKNQITAMNNVTNIAPLRGVNSTSSWPDGIGGGNITQPKAVVINGDLTEFGHRWQWKEFDKLFNPGSMTLPLYLGLGNHDYSQNIGDCGIFPLTGQGAVYSALYQGSACARFSVDYIRRMLFCGRGGVSGFPKDTIRRAHWDSLSYSWEIGDYHFVQLHMSPGFEGAKNEGTEEKPNYKRDNRVGVRPSVNLDGTGWLKDDLDIAGNKKIVINLHEPEGVGHAGFLKAIKGRNVVAVFAGHYHERWGLLDQSFCRVWKWKDDRGVPYGTTRPPSSTPLPGCRVPGTKIPIFVSGSSDQRKFLLAEFSPQRMRVAVIDSTGGTPSFASPSPGDGKPETETGGCCMSGKLVTAVRRGEAKQIADWESCRGKKGAFRKDHKGCRNAHTACSVSYAPSLTVACFLDRGRD